MHTRLPITRFWPGFVLCCLCLLGGPAVAQISLGTATDFGVLGGSTVTNTGPTTVNGSLGVSPGTAVTGFPPGLVVGGIIHLNDAVALQAQNDLTTAYNAVTGTACTTDLTGQDLGGLTLTPGVYCLSTSAQLTGTLTLDAQGNPNALFLFKIGSTLTTASNSNVLVVNGGSNCNVYWQVGTSATLGTASNFVGNILALSSITLTTGSNLSGRALARNGAVTLDSNNISACSPLGNCPSIVVNPATLPNGGVGTPYSQGISASGGSAPYAYSVSSGALPNGLVLNPLSGIISGTPTLAGTYNFTITAIDANGCPGSRAYSIVMINPGCPPVLVNPATLPPGALGAQYSQTISASGGTKPYTFTVSSGVLPTGLVLGPLTGIISGTPTAPGQFNFTITATDAANCPGSRPYSMVIPVLMGCPTLLVNPPTLPVPVLGLPYSQTISASGGMAPYTFTLSSGALPAGLLLNSASGVISGTPITAGAYSYTVTATDGNNCPGSRTYSGLVIVQGCPTIAVNPPTLPVPVLGLPYSQTISASGGMAPYTFTLTGGALPAGLLLNSASGVISGTPTTAGAYSYTVTATDGNNCLGSRTYSGLIVQTCPAITVGPATLAPLMVGRPYSQAFTASGGTAPYSFAVGTGTLPPGLALSPAGVLSGTPTSAAGFAFSITATDANLCPGSRPYQLQVQLAAIPLPALSGWNSVLLVLLVLAGAGIGYRRR